MRTQKERIMALAVDMPFGFTRFDAVHHCGVFELASRVLELEADGHRFERDRVYVPTRFGGEAAVTRYKLVQS